jgi:hypothetical protein
VESAAKLRKEVPLKELALVHMPKCMREDLALGQDLWIVDPLPGMQMDHTYQTNQELQVKRDSTLMME